MLRLVVFILAVYGAAAAITVLRAGAPLRWLVKSSQELSHFLHCPACVGFWIGCAASAFVYAGPALASSTSFNWLLVLVDGLVACGSCWIIHVVLCKLGQFEI